MGGISLYEIIDDVAKDLFGKPRLGIVETEPMEPLLNFIRNVAQNDTIPHARRSIQDSIDRIGTEAISEMVESNPLAMQMLISGQGELPEAAGALKPEDIMTTIGLNSGKPSGDLQQLMDVFNNSARMNDSQNFHLMEYSAKEVGNIAEALATLRTNLARRTKSKEWEDLTDVTRANDNVKSISGEPAKSSDPAQQLDNILAALQANNAFRIAGPENAGVIRNVADQEEHMFSEVPGSYNQNNLLEAVELLRAAGIPDNKIVRYIMSDIGTLDNLLRSDPENWDGIENLAPFLNPRALEEESRIPRSDGSQIDPELLKSMLGL